MEIWKEIKDYEGIYQISNLGRVKSFKYGKEKLLKNIINSRGYYNVHLFKNNHREKKTLHQLVAFAFLNHTPCGMELVVNHKDLNKLNNRVENLEIVTQKENYNHHIKHKFDKLIESYNYFQKKSPLI